MTKPRPHPPVAIESPMRLPFPVPALGRRLISACLIALAPGCASPSRTSSVVLTRPTVVEAACGECRFGMPGSGCDLAVRIDGKVFFVDGVHLDSLGDAHAADGMCQTIRHARVTGQVHDGRFQARVFTLVPGAP